MCKTLGKITADYRWFALVYIFGMFIIFPFLFMGLSLAGKIPVYVALGLVFLLILSVGGLSLLQSLPFVKERLGIFKDFTFLPRPLRDLGWYNERICAKVTFCQKCDSDALIEEGVIQIDKEAKEIQAKY